MGVLPMVTDTENTIQAKCLDFILEILILPLIQDCRWAKEGFSNNSLDARWRKSEELSHEHASERATRWCWMLLGNLDTESAAFMQSGLFSLIQRGNFDVRALVEAATTMGIQKVLDITLECKNGSTSPEISCIRGSWHILEALSNQDEHIVDASFVLDVWNHLQEVQVYRTEMGGFFLLLFFKKNFAFAKIHLKTF